MKYTVLLPVMGSGKRMGAGQNKLFLELRNIPILIHTLRVFERDPNCERIVLAVKKEEKAFIEQLLKEHCITKVSDIAEGGEERQHSVYAALKVSSSKGIILVHDAARPFIHQQVIQQLVEKANTSGAKSCARSGKRYDEKSRKWYNSRNGRSRELMDYSNASSFSVYNIRKSGKIS